MVAEEKLVAKDYDRLRAAGLTDDIVEAMMEVIAKESARVVSQLQGQIGRVIEASRPTLTEMIEIEVSIAATEINGHLRIHLTELEEERSAVNHRLQVVEQKVDTVRRSQPIPASKLYFDERPSEKPRRRWGRFVLGGLMVAVLGPIALSLLAFGLKIILGLMLHLLS